MSSPSSTRIPIRRLPERRCRASPTRGPKGQGALRHDRRLTNAFCQKHLNDEYAGLARRRAAALSRARRSPLARPVRYA
ncbi:DUF6398 domain-containing protein [Mesorhizobium amorphae]|uniref:DUF6398 domain-containing protein n=1 Tax=Mesorhizobium amorphae TaxID=71433 RepID=UPI003F5013DF